MKITDLPQPFGFYRVLTGSDYLHFGYWQNNHSEMSLLQAQEALSKLLLSRFPKPPLRILDVGCGLGVMAAHLVKAGYQVVAIAPSEHLIRYAEHHHPGPKYIACGFLDDHIPPLECYDIILFQESLQYFPKLSPVFEKVKQLLEPSQGRVIFCDEVSYSEETQKYSAVHEAKNIERDFAEQGFFVRYHERIGPQVRPTCEKIIQGFYEKRDELIAWFGPNVEAEIFHFTMGWEKQRTLYNQRQFGYEVWELQSSQFQVRGYQEGDETNILQAFETAFGVSRSLAHWQWKFKHSPFGGPYISTVWDETELAAHYTAYPVSLWLGNRNTITYQVGDTLTLPAYRGIGQGHTSLLARAVRHFHRLYCEGQIPFFYGFNTDKIQRFGKMFLRYYSVAPVYEWILEDEALQTLIKKPAWQNLRRGYTVTCGEPVAKWADQVFAKAKEYYGWLVVRDQQYLQWRYQAHPEHTYYFFVVRHWGQVVGWWLGRVEGKTLLIGDALFCQQSIDAPRAALKAGLAFFNKKSIKINEVRGWFSQTPQWWNKVLDELGFYSQRQWQNLDFCVTSFTNELEPEKIGDNFYFTQGDSDLF